MGKYLLCARILVPLAFALSCAESQAIDYILGQRQPLHEAYSFTATNQPEPWGMTVVVTDRCDTLDISQPSSIVVDEEEPTILQLQLQQPLLPLLQSQQSTPQPAEAQAASSLLFGVFGARRSLLLSDSQTATRNPGVNFVFGADAEARVTSDAGSLLMGTPSVLGLGVQRRNPIVTDPRIRGSRVGSLAASGSYWVPARIDLDTMLSKIDSRIIDHMTIVRGPYSALYGPGLNFTDVELLRAPRYQDGFETHGRTHVDLSTNGQQWNGRQSMWGGGSNWGFRIGYGHRTGNDYRSGNGTGIPSSFKSRDVDVALGADLTAQSAIDFSYLRLDQTDVELPGQAFDIDYLVTDGYEVRYVVHNQPYYDQFSLDTWYNRTRLEGSAQRPGKRKQFPVYNFINFTGFTDVDSMSTGYRAAFSWDLAEESQLTVGTDLRYVKQELNEITSGRIGFNIWNDANSPIPKSHASNPGLFLQLSRPVGEYVRLTTGVRADYVSMNIDASEESLAELGIPQPQSSASEILGSNQFDQDVGMGAAFITLTCDLTETWTGGASFGYAERAPNLTERYAVEPFMFLLQNGLNTVTGDPTLDKERLSQIDVYLEHATDRSRTRVTVFQSWINDYITFENMSIARLPGGTQENLKYVNTGLATLNGFELRSEYQMSGWLTPFATLQYVRGEDHTRNGDFATRQATPGIPSERVYGLPRGSFSGVAGAAKEPLPSILPLESRLGVRLHPNDANARYGIELAARVVDDQDRVAASLLETPTSGFTTWDLRTFWWPRRDLLLLGGVENFTDKNYHEHLDFRSVSGLSVFQPGISFYFSVERTY